MTFVLGESVWNANYCDSAKTNQLYWLQTAAGMWERNVGDSMVCNMIHREKEDLDQNSQYSVAKETHICDTSPSLVKVYCFNITIAGKFFILLLLCVCAVLRLIFIITWIDGFPHVRKYFHDLSSHYFPFPFQNSHHGCFDPG